MVLITRNGTLKLIPLCPLIIHVRRQLANSFAARNFSTILVSTPRAKNRSLAWFPGWPGRKALTFWSTAWMKY